MDKRDSEERRLDINDAKGPKGLTDLSVNQQ